MHYRHVCRGVRFILRGVLGLAFLTPTMKCMPVPVCVCMASTLDAFTERSITDDAFHQLALMHETKAFITPCKNKNVLASVPSWLLVETQTASRTYLSTKAWPHWAAHAWAHPKPQNQVHDDNPKHCERRRDLWDPRHRAILPWQALPTHWPNGINMSSTALVLNRALVEEINEFCVEHSLKQAPCESMPGSRVASAAAPAPDQMATNTPTTSVYTLMREYPHFTLGERFTKGGFLNAIRQPCLCTLMNSVCNNPHNGLHTRGCHQAEFQHGDLGECPNT